MPFFAFTGAAGLSTTGASATFFLLTFAGFSDLATFSGFAALAGLVSASLALPFLAVTFFNTRLRAGAAMLSSLTYLEFQSSTRRFT
jgi:hypothetical protein